MSSNKCENLGLKEYTGNLFSINKEGKIESKTVYVKAAMNAHTSILYNQLLEKYDDDKNKKVHKGLTTVSDFFTNKASRLKGEDAEMFSILNEFKNNERMEKNITETTDSILEPLFSKTKVNGKELGDDNAAELASKYLIAKRIAQMNLDSGMDATEFDGVGLYNFDVWSEEMAKQSPEFAKLDRNVRKQKYFETQNQIAQEFSSAMEQGKFPEVKEFLKRYNNMRTSLNTEYAKLYKEKTGNNIEDNFHLEDYMPIIVHDKATKAITKLTNGQAKEFSTKTWKKSLGSNKEVVLDPRVLIHEAIRSRYEGIQHLKFLNKTEMFNRIDEIKNFSKLYSRNTPDYNFYKSHKEIMKKVEGEEGQKVIFSEVAKKHIENYLADSHTPEEIKEITSKLDGSTLEGTNKKISNEIIASFTSAIKNIGNDKLAEFMTKTEDPTTQEFASTIYENGKIKSYSGMSKDIKKFMDEYSIHMEDLHDFKKIESVIDAEDMFDREVSKHITTKQKVDWPHMITNGIELQRKTKDFLGRSVVKAEKYVLTNKYGIELTKADGLTGQKLNQIRDTFEKFGSTPNDLHEIIDQMSDSDLAAEGHQEAMNQLDDLINKGDIKLMPESVSNAIAETTRMDSRPKSESNLIRGSIKLVSMYKRTWLYNPFNVARYSYRNLLGDAKAMLSTNPLSMTRMGDAGMLLHVYAKAHKKIAEDGRLPIDKLKDKEWVKQNVSKYVETIKKNSPRWKEGTDSIVDFIMEHADLTHQQMSYGATWTDSNIDEFLNNIGNKNIESFVSKAGLTIEGGKKTMKQKLEVGHDYVKKFAHYADKFLGGGEGFANFFENQRRLALALDAKRKISKAYDPETGEQTKDLLQVMNFGGTDMEPIEAANSVEEKALIFANTQLGDYGNVPKWIRGTGVIAPFLSFRYVTAKRFIKQHTNFVKNTYKVWSDKEMSMGTKLYTQGKMTGGVLWQDALAAGVLTGMWNLAMNLSGAFNADDQDYISSNQSDVSLGALFGLGGLKIGGVSLFGATGWMPKIPGLTSSASVLHGWTGHTWDNSSNMMGDLISTFYDPYSDQGVVQHLGASLIGMLNPLLKAPIESTFRQTFMNGNVYSWKPNDTLFSKLWEQAQDLVGLTKPIQLITTSIERANMGNRSGFDNLTTAKSIIFSKMDKLGLGSGGGITVTDHTELGELKYNIRTAFERGNTQRLAEVIATYADKAKAAGHTSTSIKNAVQSAITSGSATGGLSGNKFNQVWAKLTDKERNIVYNSFKFTQATAGSVGLPTSMLPPVVREI